MDEQNTRVGAERIRGLAGEDASGADTPAAPRPVREGDAPFETRHGLTGASTERRRHDYDARPGTDQAPDRRTREIRQEIEQTRDDMSETVNAIQERLRPSSIAANAAERVKDTARMKVREIADSDSMTYVAANPIPTAMVGIGVAGLVWLATAGRSGNTVRAPRTRRYYTDYTGSGWNRGDEYGRDRIGAFAGGEATDYSYGRDTSTSDRWDDDTERWPARDAEGSGKWNTLLSGRGRTGRPSHSGSSIRSAQSRLQSTWSESPLLIGAASALLGAIVGLSLPETERENQLMGEARDTVMETVQETVREKVDQVQQAATNAVNTVQEAAKSVVGLTEPKPGTPSTDRKSGGSA